MDSTIIDWANGLNLRTTEPELRFHPFREYNFYEQEGGFYWVTEPTHITGTFWGERIPFYAKADVEGEPGSIALKGFSVMIKDLPFAKIYDNIADEITLAEHLRRWRGEYPKVRGPRGRRRRR